MTSKELLEMFANNDKLLEKRFSDLSFDKLIAVLNYLIENKEATAEEIGVDGSFLASLCYRRFLKVVGKKEKLIRINEDTFKLVAVNVYSLKEKPSTIIEAYKISLNRVACEMEGRALEQIRRAEHNLSVALEKKELLNNIEDYIEGFIAASER